MEELMAHSAPESKSRLARAKDFAEFLSKLIPLVVGIIYVAGYVVTAQRLAEYNVSITQLINAQYFTAGTAPGLIICFVIAVIYDASGYHGRDSKKLNRTGLLTLGLFAFLLVISGINSLLRRTGKTEILGEDHWFDFYIMTVAMLVMGLAAVWYVVAFLKGLILFKKRVVPDSIYTAVIFLGFAVVSLLFCGFRATRAYRRIPQAYGGGQPLVVRLYLEPDRTPPELIDAGSLVKSEPGQPAPGSAAASPTTSGGEKGLVHSVPLKLIFQTSDSLIVDSAIAGQPPRVWTLDGHVVHAVQSDP
jgi:hypothetical protein